MDRQQKEALRANLRAAIVAWGDFLIMQADKDYTERTIGNKKQAFEEHLDSVVDIIAGEL